MSERPRGRVLEIGVVTLLTGVALALRIYPPFKHVFTPAGVRFQGTDSWYHMRLVDNLLGHFPSSIAFDPYAAFPDGAPVPFAPLYDLLIASVAMVLGAGAPSAALVDAVGALAPPAFGALCVVVVYALGRQLFGRAEGLLAAGLLSIAPGPFLERTLLGYADHHCAEALLSLLSLAGLAGALRRRSGTAGLPVRWSLLAGAALGAYLLAWAGGTFLVLALAAWVTFQLGLGAWRDPETSRGVGAVVAAAAGTALVAVLLFQRASARADVQAGSLVLLIAAGLALEAFQRWGAPRRVLMSAVAGALAVAAATLWLAPGVGQRAVGEVQRILPDPLTGTVVEVQPLLFRDGWLNLRLAWEHYGTGLLVLPFAALWLTRRVLKRPAPELTLILVWSIAVLVATLAQNRFGYYLAPALAVVSAALVTRLAWAGAEPSRVRVAAATALALALAVPAGRLALTAARQDRGPQPGWREALAWMRDDTEEPFGDPDHYRARYEPAPPAAARGAAAYGVLSWWDYGHWVVRMGRRVPVANPTGRGAERAARFLTATTEEEAELQATGVRYVVVDQELPLILTEPHELLVGKFQAVARWAFQDPDRFAQTVFQRTETGLDPVLLFHPDYYRSIAMRLYLFAGREVTPEGPIWVVELGERRSSRGVAYQELTAGERFAEYEAAAAYAAEQPGRKLVGLDPLRSCVPLEPLDGYSLAYDSRATSFGRLPAVRVFERLRGRAGGAP